MRRLFYTLVITLAACTGGTHVTTVPTHERTEGVPDMKVDMEVTK